MWQRFVFDAIYVFEEKDNDSVLEGKLKQHQPQAKIGHNKGFY